MKSNPRSPALRKPVGGVAAVMLTSVANIREAEFARDSALPTCTKLQFCNENEVMKCRLIEEHSSFVETLAADGQITSVTHTLRLVADRNLAEGWLEPRFTTEMMTSGGAAVVTLADGRTLVAGISRKFDREQPLRLRTIKVSSACKRIEPPTVEMVLESVDTAFAAALDIQ